jgi:7,8-dihydropterin-6-yl-methyl-4-(beta-D-ribofuranosyl)aminobenzene 5'-phosphate synthase
MLMCQCNAMHRRDVVCGGGAAMFCAIVTALIGSSKPVKAEAISGSVPELDRVAVRVVVDSYQFAVAPSRKLADVDIEHFGWGVSGDKPPGRRWSVSSASRCTPRRGAVQKDAMSSWISASPQRR